MAELFILALLGHLVGDYLLQSKEMALHKSDKGWYGMFLCTVHVAIYTIAVCVFLGTYDPVVVLAIFIPHWLIDHWSLASDWLAFIRGRTFEAAYASTHKYREFDIAFTSIVYTAVDNTMHLVCLWLVIQFLMV
ncbi:MAG: DUF3307 domain-containing protein [Patescibacteria group bacterium]